jgi:hypothetical protein
VDEFAVGCIPTFEVTITAVRRLRGQSRVHEDGRGSISMWR